MNNINGVASFRAALGQFCEASYQLAWATSKLPFSGGRKRLIFTGLPVLLLASAAGALIFAIMIKCIRTAESMLYSNTSKLYKIFYSSRSVTPFKQTSSQKPHASSTLSSIFDQIIQKTTSIPSNITSMAAPPLAPLPIDAAKERNESLLKLLELTEKFVIDPLIQKKDLWLGATYTEEGLKNWLTCMTLWRLGVAWDQLENQYVQMKTPLPPTLESIIDQAKQIDTQIGDVFQKTIPTSAPNQARLHNCIGILKAITESSLTHQKKTELGALCFRLDSILKESSMGEEAKLTEEQEIRKQFALTMHYGMANTLTHMTGIIEGWITVLHKPHLALSPVLSLNEVAQLDGGSNTNPVSNLVKNASTRVQQELTSKYLIPLWNKRYQEWNKSVLEDLKNHNSNVSIEIFEKVMNGEINERTFLESPESHLISTSLTSTIFFMKAIRYMGHDQSSLKRSMQSILDSLIAQLQPTLIDTLTKSADMLSQVSFERTIPKVVDYFIELLKCCTTIQTVRQKASQSEGHFFLIPGGSDNSLIDALTKAGITQDQSIFIAKLYKKVSLQISGKEIIEHLPKQSVHKVVRRSFESPLHEQGWIRVKKEQLKNILHLRAEKYAREEGNWLSSLFKTNQTGQPTNLVGTLLAFSTKLRDFPALEGLMTFLFSGIESVLENKGCSATQSFLNEFTSTGYLSTNIATSLIKGLLTKEEAKWKNNLPILQQAYLFLQPDEQKQILKHLAVQCEGSTFTQRKAELENSEFISAERASEIANMKKREDDYKKAETQLEFAIKDAIKKSNGQDASLLAEAFAKLKREKELQQFNRMRTLVTYIADEFLRKVFTFRTGEALKDICIRVLHEALTLLTCQEIIKHWIFTIVDLLIDELEESGNSKPIAQNLPPAEAVSLLDLIEESQRNRLLESLTDFLETAEKDKGWLNAKAWLVWGTRQVSNWSPVTMWSYIEPYKTNVAITPLQLKDRIVEWLDKFGRDPNGLSDLIIQALTEHIADPRFSLPNEPAVIQE